MTQYIKFARLKYIKHHRLKIIEDLKKVIPYFYVLPKIHKKVIKGQPIIGATYQIIESLSKIMAAKLNTLIRNVP